MNAQTNSALRDLLARFNDYVDLTDLIDNAEAFARVLIAHCHDLVIVSRSALTENGIAVAAAFIQKKADDYAAENCSTEYDTGMPIYHYGKSGMEYQHTLTELAEELAMLAAAQTTAQEK